MDVVLVSIIIPTFNRLDVLRVSLRSALQKYSFSAEVIIVDDGSSDGTAEFLAEQARLDARVRVFRNAKNLGMVGAWNAAFREARGEWVKLLCDDDELIPGALEQELAVAKSGSASLAFVAGQSAEIEEKYFSRSNAERLENANFIGIKKAQQMSAAQALRKMVFLENIVGPPPAVLFRRSFLKEFNPNYKYVTDWTAWVDLLARGEAQFIAVPVCFFRLHANNLTKHFVRTGEDIVEVFSMRWHCLKTLEKNLGPKEFELRIVFGLQLIYRLLRRFVRLCLAGRPLAMLSLLKRLPEIFLIRGSL